MKQATSMLVLGVLIGILFVVFALSGYIAGLNSSATVGSQKVVWQLGHGLPVEHPVHKAMAYMAEQLYQLSDGTMVIDIKEGEQLGSEQECVEQLMQGTLAMVKISSAQMESFTPVTAVFSYPYLFRDTEHQWKVLEGAIGQQILEEMRSIGLVGLCYYDAGARSFYTRDKLIKTPADLVGMSIRVMPSVVLQEMVTMLDATARPMAFGELYTSLQTGLVHGAENNPPSFYSSNHYEVCKYYSLDEHSMIPDMLFVSARHYDRLNDQQKQWLKQAVAMSVTKQRQLWQEHTEDIMNKLVEKGVEIYHPDKNAFFEKVKPMYDKITNEKLKNIIQQIREVQ